MAAIRGFGAYLPPRLVSNVELAARLNCDPEWIFDVSGIEERRYAAADESVAGMGVRAAENCLDCAGAAASEIGIVLVSCGSSERQFPGPASAIVHALGIDGVPAIDLPVASAGALFGMTLAAQLAGHYGNVLVVASEKMSSIVSREPVERGIVPLFGDGAGACLITAGDGTMRIVDALIRSDGTFADDLRLEFASPIEMNGRSVIMQASRKIPTAVAELLERNRKSASAVSAFVMHQANQNLMDRIARTLGVDANRFYSNIRRYGNTSSASMLIASEEWWRTGHPNKGELICFAAFGAGFHWGALLAEAV